MTKRQAPPALLDNLHAFSAFVRKRVGDADLAADIVQQALLKALERDTQLRSERNLLAWFWRILRNTIVDVQRRRSVERRRVLAVPAAVDRLPAVERERVCACLASAIDTLPNAAAALLRDVDLAGTTTEAAAAARGVSVGNLNVRRHRARKALHRAMLATCQICAEHGCVDCDCEPRTRKR